MTDTAPEHAPSLDLLAEWTAVRLQLDELIGEQRATLAAARSAGSAAREAAAASLKLTAAVGELVEHLGELAERFGKLEQEHRERTNGRGCAAPPTEIPQ